MFVVGAQNQQAEHEKCGSHPTSSLVNHLTELSSAVPSDLLTRRLFSSVTRRHTGDGSDVARRHYVVPL